MLDTYLVPPKTVVSAKGDGSVTELGPVTSRVLLLELEISGVVEQEALEVAIYGGLNDAGLGKAPIVTMPQRFHAGVYPFLLDLEAMPEIALLRAHWEVSRWGRGSETPWFEFGVRVREVPPDVLREREGRPGR